MAGRWGLRPVRDLWVEAVNGVLLDPALPAVVFEPIVDLRLGVIAGYEALSRFPPVFGAPAAGPDRWFAEADRVGLGARLEAHAVRAVLAARAGLPADCFLAVNVSPHLITDPVLAEALLDGGDLTGIVVELTEHVPVAGNSDFAAVLTRLRAAGASVALDDTGSGYSGLQQLAAVRPQIVKLDRSLVSYADRDETKLALASLLGAYAGRLDACLLAEGIERVEELEAFIRLGVPLGQGWLFGRPTPFFGGLPDGLGQRIRTLAAQVAHSDQIASLVDLVPAVTQPDAARAAAALFDADTGLDTVVVVDSSDRPWQLLRPPLRRTDPPDELHLTAVSLRVPVTANLLDVAVRAMTRDARHRFDPVVAVDEAGRFLGVVRIERLTLRLAEVHPVPGRTASPFTPT